jgi:hypothetical protein
MYPGYTFRPSSTGVRAGTGESHFTEQTAHSTVNRPVYAITNGDEMTIFAEHCDSTSFLGRGSQVHHGGVQQLCNWPSLFRDVPSILCLLATSH